jgi:hypothetical protein
MDYNTYFYETFYIQFFLTLREEHGLRVVENRVLKRIFVPKRDEVTGEWRRLVLYSSPNIICVIETRKMRWAGHVVRMRDRRGVYRGLVESTEGKRLLGRPSVDGRIILKWIFKK